MNNEATEKKRPATKRAVIAGVEVELEALGHGFGNLPLEHDREDGFSGVNEVAHD